MLHTPLLMHAVKIFMSNLLLNSLHWGGLWTVNILSSAVTADFKGSVHLNHVKTVLLDTSHVAAPPQAHVQFNLHDMFVFRPANFK